MSRESASSGKIVGLIVAFIVLAVGISLISRACNTASEMADQTVFNSSKNVWSYEEFHRKYNQYQQYKQQKSEAEAQIKDLEGKGVTSGQRYDNLVLEADGARNMMRRIAADYNSMSEIAYQNVWKSSGLPERLE